MLEGGRHALVGVWQARDLSGPMSFQNGRFSWAGHTFTKVYAGCVSPMFSAARSGPNRARWRRRNCLGLSPEADQGERMLGLYRDLYRSFTVKHFHEQLGKRHNYILGYTLTKVHLDRAGLVQAAKKRSAHRKKRPRRPMVGMMLHQDASRMRGCPAAWRCSGGRTGWPITMPLGSWFSPHPRPPRPGSRPAVSACCAVGMTPSPASPASRPNIGVGSRRFRTPPATPRPGRHFRPSPIWTLKKS